MKIIYQDENLAVLDKPAGVLVHPTEAHEKNTLVDFIIKKWPALRQGFGRQADQSRIGIVHRLDKDTSGLIIIAKNPQAQKFLQAQFKNREIEKKYLTLVLGKVEPVQGEIITQISREKGDTVKQKISSFSFSWDKNSKQAISYYHVIKNYTYDLRLMTYDLSLLEVEIKTGRMHQIRAQLAHKGWPVIGDQLYNTKESKRISDALGLSRQFLHAYKLQFTLPSKEIKQIHLDLPEDLQRVLSKIK